MNSFPLKLFTDQRAFGGLLRPHSRAICEGAELVEETWVGVVDLGGAVVESPAVALFLLVPDGGVAVASRGSKFVMRSPPGCRFRTFQPGLAV